MGSFAASANTSFLLGSNTPVPSGTANGVLYLNGSKVPTSGSALQFSGTALTVNLDGTSLVVGTGGASTTAASFRSTTRNQLRFPSGASFEWHEGVNELMRLNSTGLGIGTNNPGQKLHVAGASQYDGTLFGGSTASNTLTLKSTSGNANRSGISVGEVIASDNGGITFNVAGASVETLAMRIQGISGNVGIGTNNPTQKLEIVGDIQQQNANYLRGKLAAGTVTRIFGLNSANSLYVGGIDASQQEMLFVRGGSTQMTLDASGNLGLGTTPNANWGGLSGGALQISNGAAFARGGDELWLSWNVYHTSAGQFRYLSTAAASAYQQTNGIHIWRVGASGTAGNTVVLNDLMRLDASGNLGLGVTPSAWSTGVAIQTRGAGLWDNGTNNTYLVQNGFYNGTNWIYRNSFAASTYLQINGIHQWLIAPSGTAGNVISYTQAMTLDASGRLLLGTTSATGASMDIQATSTGTAQLLNIQNLSSGASAVSRFTLGSQGGNWHIDNERTGAPLKFTLNTTLFLQINSSGSVVIGNGALTTTTTDGFLYTASCAGVPTGAPTAYTGRVPMVVDTTNLRVYFNIGGTWRYATLT